jgi:hypothetical protein
MGDEILAAAQGRDASYAQYNTRGRTDIPERSDISISSGRMAANDDGTEGTAALVRTYCRPCRMAGRA